MLAQSATSRKKNITQQGGPLSSLSSQVKWAHTYKLHLHMVEYVQVHHHSHAGGSPFSGEGTASLYVPAVVLDGGEIEVLRDFSSRHGSFDVLLVGEDEHTRLLQVLQASKPFVTNIA